MPCTDNHAEHFLEKSRLTCAISELVNLHLLANPTYPRNPKTFGQELREKRMDLYPFRPIFWYISLKYQMGLTVK